MPAFVQEGVEKETEQRQRRKQKDFSIPCRRMRDVIRIPPFTHRRTVAIGSPGLLSRPEKPSGTEMRTGVFNNILNRPRKRKPFCAAAGLRQCTRVGSDSFLRPHPDSSSRPGSLQIAVFPEKSPLRRPAERANSPYSIFNLGIF
jgi:hypothetical protein